MFRKREYKKRGSFLPFAILRLLLSLTMLAILGIGVYQALKYFSGVDPIKVDPKTAVISLITSQDISKTLSQILGFEVPKIEQLGKLAVEQTTPPQPSQTSESSKKEGKAILKFAVVSDSHNDNSNLAKALSQAKNEGVKLVIGLGDYTEVGTVADLQKAKEIFLASELPFYSTAGDHDLWDSRNKKLIPAENFTKVFGSPYQSFSDSNIRFVIVYNSDNYEGVDQVQWEWLENLLAKIEINPPKLVFAFLQEPLYHPSSDHVMGKTRQELASQAREITSLLKKMGAAEVFSGDVHAFSRYEDPQSGLKMTTVGAVTAERNVQKPRFVIVDVFEDGGYNVEDVEIK